MKTLNIAGLLFLGATFGIALYTLLDGSVVMMYVIVSLCRS